ncbi:MAG: hypothetical protein A4S09_06420 [Proteobacteria bacterium SG_bin7]|nr:MAG: hypothetical protein A4S09_06420 [Proteobacteria bacterium SG_bin7]
MKSVLFLLLISSLTLGCNQDASKLKEKADLEGEGQSKGQQRAESERAAKMEKDLATRQNFYQAIAGIYEGTLTGVDSSNAPINLNVRLTFIPSRPPYKPDRVRTVDELVEEMNNLFLTVQVTQWDPVDKDAIVFGCTYSQVRPSLLKGEINLAPAGDCKSLFKIRVFETDPAIPSPSENDIEVISGKISEEVLTAQRSTIPELIGVRQTEKTISILTLKVKKK